MSWSPPCLARVRGSRAVRKKPKGARKPDDVSVSLERSPPLRRSRARLRASCNEVAGLGRPDHNRNGEEVLGARRGRAPASSQLRRVAKPRGQGTEINHDTSGT